MRQFLLFFVLVFCFSCSQNDASTTSNSEVSDNASSTSADSLTTTPSSNSNDKKEEEQAAMEQMVAWVDYLNIRERPNIKSSVVAKIRENETVYLTGEKTDFNETITLRGNAYSEPWVEVKTEDGKIGWAFQGALVKQGETKDAPQKEEDKPLFTPEGYTARGVLDSYESPTCEMMGDLSCACSFNTGDRYKGATIFTSNMEDNACVKINGEMNSIYSTEMNLESQLKELSTKEVWIKHDDSGTLFFGKPLTQYGFPKGYDHVVEFLTDVILASGKEITEIPIENKATSGMYIRELRDMATDAIAKAKQLKSSDFGDSAYYLDFDNRRFNVYVRARRMTNYEGEANHIDGTIMLMSNDGKTVLDTKTIKGTCGC